MQFRELLLKNTQFVLGFCAFCAKTAVSLILYVIRLYFDEKKREICFNSDLGRHTSRCPLLRKPCSGSALKVSLLVSFHEHLSVNSCSEWGKLSSGKAASLKSFVGSMCFQNCLLLPRIIGVSAAFLLDSLLSRSAKKAVVLLVKLIKAFGTV